MLGRVGGIGIVRGIVGIGNDGIRGCDRGLRW